MSITSSYTRTYKTFISTFVILAHSTINASLVLMSERPTADVSGSSPRVDLKRQVTAALCLCAHVYQSEQLDLDSPQLSNPT